MTKLVDLWLDLKSPYSFIAKDPAYAMAAEIGVTLRLRPFTLDIAGSVNPNDPAALQRGFRKIKYLYTDVRRFARPRGLTILGPKKIFDSKLVHMAWMFAERQGKGRALIDLAYPRFFLRELDYEDRAAIDSLLAEVGADPTGFATYVEDEGPGELARHQKDAEEAGVFAVPTFVVDGELFWGQDRIDFVRARLAG